MKELSEVVKRSLNRYTVNPILILPPLVMMIVSFVPDFIPWIMLPWIMLIYFGFGIQLLTWMLSFLCLLGQAAMTGKAVVEGNTGLAHWVMGVKRYFWRVLGVSLILYAILGFFIILGFHALTTAPWSPYVEASISLVAIAWVVKLSKIIIQAVFYFWLAPIVVDDKGIGVSFDAGIKALRNSGGTFLGFIALFFAISAIADLIGVLPKPINMLSQAVTTIFSPLWFLIAFTIYHEQKFI